MLIQVLTVAAAFMLALLLFGALGVPLAGPIAVVVGVLVASALLQRAGSSWRALGLSWPLHPGRLAGATLGVVALAYLTAACATLLATRGLGWPAVDVERLVELTGNPALLGLMLLLAWTTAAFGEELLFRGFLQTRLQALLARWPGATALAVLLQAVLFGFGHAYQGPTGILVTGSLGLVFGTVYARQRSLWPIILAHGVIDTIGLLALYAGVRPAG